MSKLCPIKKPIKQCAFYGPGTFYFSCTGTWSGCWAHSPPSPPAARDELTDPLELQVGEQAPLRPAPWGTQAEAEAAAVTGTQGRVEEVQGPTSFRRQCPAEL